MTLNGVMAVILRYFTEFVYDVAVKQLPRFQSLLLKGIDHIKTICAIIQLLLRQNKLITRFDGRRCIQGFIQAPSGGNLPQTSEIPPPMSEVCMMASCSDCSGHSLRCATVSLYWFTAK